MRALAGYLRETGRKMLLLVGGYKACTSMRSRGYCLGRKARGECKFVAPMEVQHAGAYRLNSCRLWNTGSPGQAGRGRVLLGEAELASREVLRGQRSALA